MISGNRDLKAELQLLQLSSRNKLTINLEMSNHNLLLDPRMNNSSNLLLHLASIIFSTNNRRR